MSALQVEFYIRRAKDFLDAVILMRDEPRYSQSTALLAIHSAISYSDALRTALGDSSLASDDHQHAIQKLKRLLSAISYKELDGLGHFEHLLTRKSRIAYGKQRLDEKDYRLLMTKSERFTAWANEVSRNLHLEGWNFDE